MKIVPDTFDDCTDQGDLWFNLEHSMTDVKYMMETVMTAAFDLTEHHQHGELPKEFKGEIDNLIFLTGHLQQMFSALRAEYMSGFKMNKAA